MCMRGLALVPAVALSIVAGCVELTGQRISWFHDEAADELRILIFYDGIHDSGSDQYGKGTTQVPEFVANGDVMVVDWIFHLEMDLLRRTALDPEASPAERDAARLATSMRVEPLGYYREPDGRVGAAQRITIPGVSRFVRELNAAISAAALESNHDDGEMPRTIRRMREAAQGGHEWVTLDGHAFKLKVPVHPGEWARGKGQFLTDLIEDAGAALDEEDEDARRLVQSVTSAPVSYVDEGDWVTFVLGARAFPVTLRLGIRDEYEPSLEGVVAETLKVDLDQALADDPGVGGADGQARLLDIVGWGPPEERVRAILSAASGEDEPAQRAMRRLEAFAESWNAGHGVPEAPLGTQDDDAFVSAWKRFYEALKQYPIGAPGGAGDGQLGRN